MLVFCSFFFYLSLRFCFLLLLAAVAVAGGGGGSGAVMLVVSLLFYTLLLLLSCFRCGCVVGILTPEKGTPGGRSAGSYCL